MKTLLSEWLNREERDGDRERGMGKRKRDREEGESERDRRKQGTEIERNKERELQPPFPSDWRPFWPGGLPRC